MDNEACNNYNFHERVSSAKSAAREVRKVLSLHVSLKLKAEGLKGGIKLRPVEVKCCRRYLDVYTEVQNRVGLRAG